MKRGYIYIYLKSSIAASKNIIGKVLQRVTIKFENVKNIRGILKKIE